MPQPIPNRFTDAAIALFATQAGERARLAATHANAQIAAKLIDRPVLSPADIDTAAAEAHDRATLEAHQANEEFDLLMRHRAARTELGQRWQRRPAATSVVTPAAAPPTPAAPTSTPVPAAPSEPPAVMHYTMPDAAPAAAEYSPPPAEAAAPPPPPAAAPPPAEAAAPPPAEAAAPPPAEAAAPIVAGIVPPEAPPA